MYEVDYICYLMNEKYPWTIRETNTSPTVIDEDDMNFFYTFSCQLMEYENILHPLLLKHLYHYRYFEIGDSFGKRQLPLISYAEKLSALPSEYLNDDDKLIIKQGTIMKLTL